MCGIMQILQLLIRPYANCKYPTIGKTTGQSFSPPIEE